MQRRVLIISRLKKKQADYFKKQDEYRKRVGPKNEYKALKRRMKQDFKKRVRQKVAKINFVTGK